MQELIGKTIGQYRIIEQIGKGGMATIFKAYQPSVDRYVAIKVLPLEFAKDPNFVKRFEQEAKAIAALEHSHILPVHDFGTQDNVNYMVMRYVPSGTLSDVMGKRAPLEKVVKYVGDVARALDYAHSRGVVHRDIKPSNILLDEQGDVLLTDFGIAKMVQGAESTQLTATGAVLGTPAYLSPEQAKSTTIDGRSDIYSLGVVLYELLTGQPPYQAETPLAVVLKHLHDPLPPPRTIDPTIPEAFERVVFKAMAKNPNDRFATAGDMARALNNALLESQTQRRPETTPLPAPPPVRETPAVKTMSDAPGQTMQMAGEKSRSTLYIIGGVALALACATVCGLGLLLSRPTDTGPATKQSASSVVQLETAPTATPTALPATATVPALTDTPTVPPPADTPTPPPADTLPDNPVAYSGDVLFEDEFSSNANDWPVEYHEDELGYYDARVENGEYAVVVQAATEDGHTVWFLPNSDNVEDFIAQVDVTASATTENFLAGLVVRSNDEAGGYFFEIDSSGFSVALNDANDKWTDLVKYTVSDAIVANEVNRLRLEAVGSTFTFYINDQQVATVEDATVQQGQIGLVAEMFDKDGETNAWFDNLQVTVP